MKDAKILKKDEKNKLIFTFCLNKVDGLTADEINDFLLEKEKFWIRILVT